MAKHLPTPPPRVPRENADFGNGPNFDKYAFMGFLIVGFLVVLFMNTFTSCSRTIHETTTENSMRTIVRIDTLEKVKIIRDSVLIRDSVETKIFQRGDTVFLEKIVTRWRERLTIRADTAKARTKFADEKLTLKEKQYRKNTTAPWGWKIGLMLILGAGFVLFALPKIYAKIWLRS